MFQELLNAFILIFIAEMGDKTQLLAMAFATKYPVKKVLLGIFIGILINHGLAVCLGCYISSLIPVDTVKMIAGLAFVGFALWSLKSEEEDDENQKLKCSFGPVCTVATVFFIGELGDKTQLTAITLATDANNILVVLGGTVLGMMVTGVIGILVGKKLGNKVHTFLLKIIAATVFMFFGLTKLYVTIPEEYLNVQNILLFLGMIVLLTFLIMRPSAIKKRNTKKRTYIADER
ncbi:MAG: TMEM165/GDT1 family protein [Clostridia bacterium]|nr:TMEM165/GDT1 family protein [Clostridia bacterium]